MKRCALQLLPVAFFAFVFGGAGAAPEAFATVAVPIVVGWIWAAHACAVGKRLRDDVAAGIVRSPRHGRAIAFVFLFPLGVAISSLVALEITNYVGAGFSDMAGLIPALFGIGAFALAVIAVGVHELELARIRRQRSL